MRHGKYEYEIYIFIVPLLERLIYRALIRYRVGSQVSMKILLMREKHFGRDGGEGGGEVVQRT